ncbi:phage minor head protein [Bowmanella denitrificans]|uniref:phage head morphogenesis protein n=1 Tax=Bowmanella denitrificans TaxID=366582 RepID=UPI000C9C13E6|nr:phage minor head protein [Bowmanella denitrificans]
MPEAQYGSLPFTQAIEFFRSKLNVPAERWADIWRDQHNSAFMVAGATKRDLIADLRQMVDAAIAEGKSLTWFKSEFKHLVKKHGWDHTGSAAWRANIIYGTNMRQSYNAGRWEQLQAFPYWRYAHGDSRFPRPHHLKHHGLILPKDSPFWQVWFPQNGWGCKCKVYGVTEAQMRRRGWQVSEEPVIDTVPWTDKATGEVHHVPVGIDPGFDYAPGRTKPAQHIQQLEAAKPALPDRLPRRLVPSAFSTVKGMDIHGLNRILAEIATKRPELEQVSAFVKRYQIKTLILKPTEISTSSKRIKDLVAPIADYLQVDGYKALRSWPVSPSVARKAGGYTAHAWHHLVIKAKSNLRLSNVTNVDELINAVEAGIVAHANGAPMWTFSSIVRNFGDSGEAGSSVLTWLHELGHQVHFRVIDKGYNARGLPTTLTRYAGQDVWEWHAEHFVAWALNRPKLVEHHPDIAEYFDNIMKALND